MKRIPIEAAKRMASEHGLKQVIVMAWDGERSHVVTYGVSAEDCDQAAQGGDLMKKTMGWPEHTTFPSRVKALQKQVAELRAQLADARALPAPPGAGDEGACKP